MDIDYARIGRLMTLSKGRTHDPTSVSPGPSAFQRTSPGAARIC